MRHLLPDARCALTAPFHPCHVNVRQATKDRRFTFCGAFPRVTPAGISPAPCPMELGLSSRMPVVTKHTSDRPDPSAGKINIHYFFEVEHIENAVPLF